jgi:hypothetical protein
MKKTLIALVALSLSAFLIAGCDGAGGGGPLRPIANKGGAPAAKPGGGPHPMPGSSNSATGN